MKKLVLVSIVIAITSLSPAGMHIIAPDTIEQGSTVNLAIVTDDIPDLDFAGTVWVNKATNNAAGDLLSNVIITPEPVIFPILPPVPYPGLPDSFTFGQNLSIPIASIPQVTFDLTHVGTPLNGNIVIALKDLTSGTVMAHYLKVVPEPCSLLLLGLGGLVLRRRWM